LVIKEAHKRKKNAYPIVFSGLREYWICVASDPSITQKHTQHCECVSEKETDKVVV